MFIFNKQIFPILCVCFLYDKYPIFLDFTPFHPLFPTGGGKYGF